MDSEAEFIREGIEKGRETARKATCPECGAVGPDEVFKGIAYYLKCPECGYQTFGHRFIMEGEDD